MTVTTLDDGGFRFFRNVGDITVDATNVEVIEANSGDGNDVIIASGQTDPNVSLVVEAGGGNDVIVGGQGNDDLKGNTGDDVAFGLSGDDSLPGIRVTATTPSTAATAPTRSNSTARTALSS